MDRLTFISQLTAALAWPITTLLCVILLRKIFADLVPLLRTLKYSDFEFHFGKEVAALKDTAAAAGLQIKGGRRDQEETRETLIRLAALRPRTAFREAWRKVESDLVELAKKRNLQVEPMVWTMPMVLGALMFNAGIISDAQYTLLTRLRQLTSEAERAPVDSLTSEDAISIVELALGLAASLTGDA